MKADCSKSVAASRERGTTAGAVRGISRFTTPELVAVLVLVAVLPYLNSLLNGFVQDDNRQVLFNPYIRSFSHLREIFTTNVWSYVGAQGTTNYYRPLMMLGYLICYRVFGPLSYGFHLANVLLNAGVVCLIFLVTEWLFKDRTLGFVAAVMFALHPIHSESVAWVAAVTDLQLTFFYLLTFWFFFQVPQPGGKRSGTAELGMVLSFTLALLAKEPAATLPFAATFFEHFLREDRAQTSLRQKFSRYGTLWLLDAAYLMFRLRIFGGLAPVVQLPKIGRHEAFDSSFALVAQYIWKLIWPVDLRAFYVFHGSARLLDPRVMAGFLVLGLCLVAFLYFWKKERLVSFGLLWIFLNIAPVLNARWLGANVFAERYLYLPSLGFCWIAAWGGGVLWRRLAGRPAGRKFFAAVLVVVAILCALRIITRNRIWHDDATFYKSTLAAEPDAIGLRINLGAVYWHSGSPDLAEAEWREALRRAPDHWLILNNLGLVSVRKKRYDEAMRYFQRSIELRPSYADSHMNLGRTYAVTGDQEKAEMQLRTAVALAPLYVPARNELAKFYFNAGWLAEAEQQYRSSVSSGGTIEAWNSLGEIYSRWDRWQDAERAFRQAAALDPFDSTAHFGLGAVLDAGGRTREALNEYELGLRTDPQNPAALKSLERLRKLFSDANKPKN
jgi:tetratricopeptide (TPR) repeat protein